ncbi:Kelch repeat-containing protein, partial [Candidatus Poribacteria bacterium]
HWNWVLRNNRCCIERKEVLIVKREVYIIFAGLVLCGLIMTSMNAVAAVEWGPKADMPTQRCFLSTSVLDGKIYAIAGSLDLAATVKTVEVYDPVSNTWEKKADMKFARQELSTSVVNGKIHAIGGFRNFRLWFSIVEEYDPATDTWTRKAGMPTKRAGLSTSVVNGKLYAIGGSTDDREDLVDQKLFATVEEYDPATDTWTAKADMPTARTGLSTSVVNGKIYAIGGGKLEGDVNVAFPTVEEYDPATDTWTKKTDMPTERYTQTCVVNGRIYAIGGSPDLNAGLATVEEYNPATDTWTRKEDMVTPDLPTTRDAHALSVVNGGVYVIGGTQSLGAAACLPTVEHAFPQGFSVSPHGRLTTTWGEIKQRRQ